MKEIIEIPHTQVVMSFIATCIEATARTLNKPYCEVFHRMQNLGMIDNYLLPHYETIHSESRENIVSEILEYFKSQEMK